MGKSLIVGASLLAMASTAQAEPMQLTSGQMDEIAAGALINLNIAVVTQIAVPTAISIATCVVCNNPRLRPVAIAVGENISRALQR